MSLAHDPASDIPLIIQWANFYADKGFSIIPTAEGEKRPGLPWEEWQVRRPDKNQLSLWLTGLYRNCGIGVVTGKVSGNIFVVDADSGEGKQGPENLDDVQMMNDDFPVTWTSKTGGGGRHSFFRAPEGVRIKTGKNVLAQYVDVRGEAGFLVLPPSPHPSGQAYEWIRGVDPASTEIADAPDWLLAICRDDADVGLAPHQPAASSIPGEFNAFGRRVDGREEYMRDLLWARLIEERRECPFPLTQGVLDKVLEECWAVFERRVKARSGSLSGDSRGIEEMRRKLKYAAKKWDGKIAVEAARPKPAGAWQDRPVLQPFTPDPPGTPTAVVNDDVGPFQATDLTGEPPERRWLVKDWIPEGTVTSLYGDGGVGKTLVAQQLAYSAAVGRPWVGLAVPKTCTLAVMCEDERDEIHRRHHAIKAGLGYAVGNPFGEVWLWPRVGFDNLLVTFDRDGTPRVSALFERIRLFVIERKIGLLILDTAADLYGGNEIVRSEVNYFLKAVCGRLVREAGDAGHVLTVLILAHPSQAGKESGQGFSGNTAWNNGVRARLYLNAVEDGHPDERILTRKKSNYSRAGDGEQINLIWNKGVLERMEISERGQLILAKERILKLVEEAWNEGVPYLKRKGLARNLELKMVEYLSAEGMGLGSIVEALRELKEEELITVKSVNGRHGWSVK